MLTFHKLRIRIFLLLLVVFAIHVQLAYSQFTNVSAVVQDSNGNLYPNCSYAVDYVYSPGSSQNPLLSGSPFQMSYGGAKCDSFAAFSIRLPDNNSITPSGSQWRFSICDSTGTKCFTSAITITGANQVITSTLSAAAPSNAPLGGAALLTGNNVFTGSNTFAGITDSASIVGKKIGGVFYADQNGLACNWNGSTGTDDTTAMQALINTISNGTGGGTILIPAGKACRITAQLTIPGQIIFRGEVANGGAFGSGSFLVADYTEGTATNGFLNWNGNQFLTSGIGGGLQHIVIWKATGRTGGSPVSLTSTDCNHRSGHMLFEDVRVTGDGTWNYGFFGDGTACSTSGSQGIRDVTLIDYQPFQTTTAGMLLKNMVHFYWYGATTSPTGGGNADIKIDGGGTALTNSTDIVLSGSISGNLVLDNATQVRCAGCYVSGTVSSTANTTNSTFQGIGGAYSLTNGLAVFGYDNSSAANQNMGFVQALRAAGQLVAGTASANCTVAGFLCTATSATGGTWLVGSDGLMGLRRNNGSGAGTNLALTWDTFSTTPFQFDSANGFINTVNTSSKSYSTATNCSSSASPAVCGSAAAGSAVIAAAATTVVVNTSAVTASSQILITRDDSLGTKLSVTCNTQSSLVLGTPRVTARTAATSFTVAIDVGPTTNPMCFSYSVVN